jgi:exonuclease VII small subunit
MNWLWQQFGLLSRGISNSANTFMLAVGASAFGRLVWSEDSLDAAALGLAAAGLILAALGAISLSRAFSLHVAARRVAALGRPPSMRSTTLLNEVLHAFGHSKRLHQIAESFLSQAELSGIGDVKRARPGRPISQERSEQNHIAEIADPMSTIWVLRTAIALIAVGVMGLPCLLVGTLGPRSIGLGSDVSIDISGVLSALSIGSLAAGGIGVAGVAGLLEWRLLGMIQRRAMRRLQRAVETLVVGSSSGEAVMTAYARQTGDLLKGMEKLLKDEKKARVLERNDNTAQIQHIIARLEQSIRSLDESTKANTELSTLVRRSMESIIDQQERLTHLIEDYRAGHDALMRQLQESDARRNGEEQAPAISVQDSVARLASIVDTLAQLAVSLANTAPAAARVPVPEPSGTEGMILELETILGKFEDVGARYMSAREKRDDQVT